VHTLYAVPEPFTAIKKFEHRICSVGGRVRALAINP
jgi:hypothetical protein